MNADLWFEVAKILGVASTALLGAIGILGDFRTADKNLSKYGYWMIVGIFISGTLTVIATAHDDHSQDKHLADQMAANSKELKALYRLQAPLERFQGYFVLVLPQSEPAVSSYVARLKADILAILQDPATLAEKLRPSFVAHSIKGVPQVIDIRKGSPLYPNSRELDLEPLVSRLNLVVNLYGADTVCCESEKSDLMEVGYAYANHPSFEFDLTNSQLYVTGLYGFDVGRSNGLVGSIPDLLGARLILQPVVAPIPSDPASAAASLVAASTFKSFALTVADGKQLWFQDQALRPLPISKGIVSFATTLPTSDLEFSRLYEPKKAKQQWP
jgi:hypothetical protein